MKKSESEKKPAITFKSKAAEVFKKNLLSKFGDITKGRNRKMSVLQPNPLYKI